MAQMTPEVSKLLEQALALSVEEQEALADSLISNLGGKEPFGNHLPQPARNEHHDPCASRLTEYEVLSRALVQLAQGLPWSRAGRSSRVG